MNLKNMLREWWVQIEFVKSDGTLRKLLGTTNLDLIPENFHPKKQEPEQETKKEETPNTLYKVYEKDNGWRSFRHDQIVSLNGVGVFNDTNC